MRCSPKGLASRQSWVEIEEYGYSKQEWLKQFLALPNGIPSRDTIRRLFAQLDPKQLQNCFLSWIKTIAQLTQGEVIAIRVGLIESERRIEGKPSTIERRYYLLSLDGGVERFAQAVRSHWCIENQLHWCLDVAFNEDDSRIRCGYAPENMSLIRHIALNLLGQETSVRAGKKAKRKKAGWDNAYLVKVLAG